MAYGYGKKSSSKVKKGMNKAKISPRKRLAMGGKYKTSKKK